MSNLKSHSVSRRKAMAGVIAAPLAVSTANAAKATQVDPHPEWLARYWQVHDEIPHAPEGSDEEKRLYEEEERLTVQLCRTPARTPDGLLAQFDWFEHDLAYFVTKSVGPDHAKVFEVLRESILLNISGE